jgi:hypothetical protein
MDIRKLACWAQIFLLGFEGKTDWGNSMEFGDSPLLQRNVEFTCSRSKCKTDSMQCLASQTGKPKIWRRDYLA